MPMNEETSKLAADMVAQQIASYDQQILQLQQQWRDIDVRMQAVRMMRNALLPLLQDTSSQLQANGNGMVQEDDSPSATALSPDGIVRLAITGFADAVRDVLKDYPKGLAPSDVAEQMKSRGTSSIYKGKTQFSVRVGNELHRLMKSGELVRRAGRYYFATHESHQ